MIHLSTFEFCKTYRLFFQVFEKIVIDTAVTAQMLVISSPGELAETWLSKMPLPYFRPVIGDASKRKESILMIVVRVVVAQCIEELSVHAHRAGGAPGAEKQRDSHEDRDCVLSKPSGGIRRCRCRRPRVQVSIVRSTLAPRK